MTNTITESAITDDKLRADGFTVLVKALGDVNAERFIMLMNREPFDYTEWRRDNLFVGETVDSLMDKAEKLWVFGLLRRSFGVGGCVRGRDVV